MGLLDVASGKSFWRGYDYFRNGKVASFQELEDGTYAGKVEGSKGNAYEVTVNLQMVRSSTCTCPFKADKPKAICKHIVATYFAIFPDEADRVWREYQEWEAGSADRKKERIAEIEEHVNSLSIDDLRRIVLDKMIDDEFNSRNYWQALNVRQKDRV